MSKIISNTRGTMLYGSDYDFGSIANAQCTVIHTFDSPISDLNYCDDSIVALSEGKNIWKYDTSTGDLSKIYTHSETIELCIPMGKFLVLQYQSDYSTCRMIIDRETQFIIGTDNSYYYSSQYLADQDTGRIISFGSPFSSQYIDLVTGESSNVSSGVHYTSYNTNRTILVDSGKRLILSDGTILDTTDNLGLSGSFPFDFTDLAIMDGSFFVLTPEGQLLRTQSQAPFATQKNIATYSGTPARLIAVNGKVTVFLTSRSNNNTLIKTYGAGDLGSNSPATSAPEETEDGLRLYRPVKYTLAGANDTLYFAGGNVFGTINDDGTQTILQYLQQTITGLFQLDTSTLIISDKKNLWSYSMNSGDLTKLYTLEDSTTIQAICKAGAFVILFTGDYYITKLLSIDPASSFIASTLDSYYMGSDSPVWSSASNTFFASTFGLSPKDLEYYCIDPDTGSITAKGDSQYHGGYSWNSPYRISPDGSTIFTADGDLFSALSPTTDCMVHTGSLPSSCKYIDMQFMDSSLLVLTQNKQLVRVGGASPYTFQKNNFTFGKTPQSLTLGTNSAWVICRDDTQTCAYFVKKFARADL